jgi:hypothetical protein
MPYNEALLPSVEGNFSESRQRRPDPLRNKGEKEDFF